MAEVVLTEECTWDCVCAATGAAECAHIRPRLAELDCSDAIVGLLWQGINKRTFSITRTLKGANASCKLAMPGSRYLHIAYRVPLPNGDSRCLFTDDAPLNTDSLDSPIASAFGGLLLTWPSPEFSVEHAQTLTSNVVQAAESFGLTYRDVLYHPSSSDNILHSWAIYWREGCRDAAETLGALLADIQSIVEPSVYREMLRERDRDDRTPYDIASAKFGATSDFARLFQLTGPKSAAATE